MYHNAIICLSGLLELFLITEHIEILLFIPQADHCLYQEGNRDLHVYHIFHGDRPTRPFHLTQCMLGNFADFLPYVNQNISQKCHCSAKKFESGSKLF